MSLLLDALKRAEQAKQGSSLSLEPIDGEMRAPSAPVNPAIAGVAPGPSLGSAARRAEQEAAKALFTAKQLPSTSRPLWLLLGGLALLCIAAGAFWLWYALTFPATSAGSMRPPQSTGAMMPNPTPLLPPPEPPKPAVAANATPTTPSIAAATPTTAEAPTTESKPVEATDPPRVKSGRSRTKATPAASETNVGPQVKPSPKESAVVSPELATAYQALTRGEYAIAKQQYQLVVDGDPFNLDGHLGLATVAASTGDFVTAQSHYRRALEIDPKNAVAHAGIAAIESTQNAGAAESHLRAQIAANRQAAPTHSALGHVYSSQGRWGEAQQAFFEAYRLEPTSPDYAFNLAISLDHLGQNKLAREYYSKAISLAASRPAAFSVTAATDRMNRLAP
jgi:tetratricopeptide (TPR) repeat protein